MNLSTIERWIAEHPEEYELIQEESRRCGTDVMELIGEKILKKQEEDSLTMKEGEDYDLCAF